MDLKEKKSAGTHYPDRPVNNGLEVNSQKLVKNQEVTKANASEPGVKVRRSVLEEHGFIIGKEIGRGAYAKVKIAYSEEYKCVVAVKVISKIKTPREYLEKFLIREIDVVKGLHHENLIRFYQCIETTHRLYIVMELAANGSLLDYIRKAEFLSEQMARRFFTQLIRVLDYCHRQGVAHRDVKCENLLFDKNLTLKLIDFGFARPVETSDQGISLSETYCGSFAYASPEILKGIPYDPRETDVWAAGVVLYAMVYGDLPFDGSHVSRLIKQVQRKIVFPATPNVSLACQNLIKKILCPRKSRYRIHEIINDPWFLRNESIEI